MDSPVSTRFPEQAPGPEGLLATDEAAEHLTVIRRIMESATRITVLPARAAAIGGLLALAGCCASYALTRSLDFAAIGQVSPQRRCAVVGLWVAVATLGIVVDVLMTVRTARRRGVSPWPRMSQLAAYAMGPNILIALALSIALARAGLWGLTPGVWMMCYGAAVWMAGILSLRAPGWLGAAFMVAGVVTLFWLHAVALVMVALTFGLGHVAFGVYLLRKFGE